MYSSLLINHPTHNYTARYKQLLLQLFSDDGILQLVLYSAISLLIQYADSRTPDPRLQPLVPALSMLFMNSIASDNASSPVDSKELRRLARFLASKAKIAFNDLVHKREYIRQTSTPPPPLLTRE